MGVVRYYLALSVVMAHFSTLTGVEVWWPTSSYDAVGGFFALSGFLVYGSYLRAPSLKTFIANRARRILPAYSFIILLCAFGLVGLSTLPAAEYFTSWHWWRYLLSNLTFLNFLCPDLPGVFSGNEMTAVNGSLWTLKVEWMLYLTVPLVAWLIAKLRRPALHTFVTIYLFSMLYRLGFQYLYETQGREIWNILGRQFFGQLMYFYTGVVVYFHREQFLRYRRLILVVAILLTILGAFIPYYEITLGPAVVSVLVLWFSLVGSWGRWGNENNISYDIYLTHFPVIQLVYALGVVERYGIVAAFVVSMLGIVLLGLLTWFGLGKWFLRRKR
jgi:peptidoglycan/LPS O-acetylase OafA/YrhL